MFAGQEYGQGFNSCEEHIIYNEGFDIPGVLRGPHISRVYSSDTITVPPFRNTK